MTEPSEFVRDAAHRVVGILSIVGPMSKVDLATFAAASAETVQRALAWLRSIGAPITCRREAWDTWTWTIAPGWRIPTHELPRAQILPRIMSDGGLGE